MLALFLAASLGTTPPSAYVCRDHEAEGVWVAWRRPSMSVAQRSTRPEPEEILAVAREYLGTPYVFGGVGEGGFDCSGFTNKVYARVGYDLPRTSREQFEVGLEVPRPALATGDLLFFVSSPGNERITHVGIYAGDGELIHAAVGKGEVTYDRLGSRYYSTRLTGARRIVVLPPGIYSTPRGTARPGVFFPAGEAVTVESQPPAADVPSDDEIGQLIAELTEHEEAPPQVTTRLVAGAVTQVGPRFLYEDATAFGVRVAGGRMNDRGALFLVPEASYFGHDTTLRVVLAAPLLIPVDANVGDSLNEQWSTAHDYTKVVQQISYGQKESQLYVDLSRTASATLGHGQVMRYYTPNIASRYTPHYAVDPDALSLAFDGALDPGELELFVDDLFAPRVLGLHAGVHPLARFDVGQIPRSLSTAINYAVDVRAPYVPGRRRDVHGVGMELTLTPLASTSVDLETYVDVSSILHAGGGGAGGALGGLLRANIMGHRRHVLRSRLEARLSGPAFIPSYFDTTYRLNRAKAPVDDPGGASLSKLALLEELEGTPMRWGVYGELTYRYGRRFHIGLSYEDGGALGSLPASESYTGRSLMLFGGVRNLYLPGSSRKLDLYLAYHLRNFEDPLPIFGMSRTNEYLFLAASVQLWRFLAVGGSIRKAANPAADEAALDAVLEMTLRYEI